MERSRSKHYRPEPVSYTHLDVYKRQRNDNTNKLQQRGKQMETMTTMKILKKKKEEGQGNVP